MAIVAEMPERAGRKTPLQVSVGPDFVESVEQLEQAETVDGVSVGDRVRALVDLWTTDPRVVVDGQQVSLSDEVTSRARKLAEQRRVRLNTARSHAARRRYGSTET